MCSHVYLFIISVAQYIYWTFIVLWWLLHLLLSSLLHLLYYKFHKEGGGWCTQWIWVTKYMRCRCVPGLRTWDRYCRSGLKAITVHIKLVNSGWEYLNILLLTSWISVVHIIFIAMDVEAIKNVMDVSLRRLWLTWIMKYRYLTVVVGEQVIEVEWCFPRCFKLEICICPI